MSKTVKAGITCPACKNNFPTELYRTIWVEYPQNRSLIFNNEINAVTCPHCKHHERLKFPFLCTNVERGFALWYEPYHDPEIDKDIAGYRKVMGSESFHVKAPRISDWEDFKKKLLEMEAKAPTKASPPLSAKEKQKKTTINPLLFFLYVFVFGCLIAYFLGYLPLEELLFDLTGVRFN